MPDHFMTEFGHRIDFVPGYFERNKGPAYYAKSSNLPASLSTVTGNLSIAAPLKDWVLFSSLIYFMSRYDLLERRRNGIDLGGAEGTLIRMFKAAGFLEHATNLDIQDFSPSAGDEYFSSFIASIKNMTKLPKAKFDAYQNIVATAKHSLDHFGGQPAFLGMHTDFPHASKLDSNLHMSALDAPGTYDLVLTSYCLEFFDLDVGLAKVRSLLNPNGLFVGLIGSWWWIFNATGVVGHFPYACQRLSFADLTRYYTEHHPDLLDLLYFRYNFFHEGAQHPTTTDLVSVARKHGLRLVAVERSVPRRHPLIEDCPPALLKTDWFDHREVLRDIHHLKPDVVVDDLLTSGVRLAFAAI